MQMSICSCSVMIAEILPFPSEPNCPPTTTQTLTRDSSLHISLSRHPVARGVSPMNSRSELSASLSALRNSRFSINTQDECRQSTKMYLWLTESGTQNLSRNPHDQKTKKIFVKQAKAGMAVDSK